MIKKVVLKLLWMDSKPELDKLWMVAKERNDLYGAMGIGKFLIYIKPTSLSLIFYLFYFSKTVIDVTILLLTSYCLSKEFETLRHDTDL